MKANLEGEKYRQGRIEVVCGSMFSGKTEELIRRIKRATFARQRVVIFKPQIDTRYSEEEVVSHDRNAVMSVPLSTSTEILEYVQNHTTSTEGYDFDVVGIGSRRGVQPTRQQRCARDYRRLGHGFPVYALRADTGSVRRSRRGDKGTRHLREVRSTRLCEPPPCARPEPGAHWRANRIRTALPRVLQESNKQIII